MQRRDALAAESMDAFVVEPGYAFSYYANVTQQDWEPCQGCGPPLLDKYGTDKC